MTQLEEEIERNNLSLDIDTEDYTSSSTPSKNPNRKREKAKRAAKKEISTTRLALSIVGSLIAIPVVSGIIPIPFIDWITLLGVTTVLGFSGGSYFEGVLTGGISMGVFALLSSLSLSIFAGFGIPAMLVSIFLGLIVGGIGVYAGKDTRDGFDKAGKEKHY